jgi:hypothetical protein
VLNWFGGPSFIQQNQAVRRDARYSEFNLCAPEVLFGTLSRHLCANDNLFHNCNPAGVAVSYSPFFSSSASEI